MINFFYIFQAPWRVPGNFEIPDIIKEAWDRNKEKIHTTLHQKKKSIEPVNNVQTKVINK